MTEAQFRSFIFSLLRRGTYRWKPRSECFRNARVSRGIYECNLCKGHFRAKDVVADHVFPVVDPSTGFVDFDVYIRRMYPQIDGFQILCSGCHDVKSQAENQQRKEFRKNSLTSKKKPVKS